jgi:serine/threonine protein kinase
MEILNYNKELMDEYVIVNKIGSGSFGDVYSALNKYNTYIAIKIEQKSKKSRLVSEYKIYKKLYNRGLFEGIPKIYKFIETKDYDTMIMQLLGPSLDELFTIYNKKFKLETVLLLGIQITKLIKNLHLVRFIHRDIKPNNFLIGRNDVDKNMKYDNKIYLMDFGLSKQYIDSNGSHMRFNNDRSLIGTARYASINMHNGYEPSRRDDFESIGYMLIYFLLGSLPWQKAKKVKGCSNIDTIGKIKKNTDIIKICKNLPTCFVNYIQYAKNLSFDEEPNYEYLINLFVETAVKLNIEPCFEWSI